MAKKSKKRIYNPKTKSYYSIRQRSSSRGKKMISEYDKEVDVLLIKIRNKKPVYGEDIGKGIIVHYVDILSSLKRGDSFEVVDMKRTKIVHNLRACHCPVTTFPSLGNAYICRSDSVPVSFNSAVFTFE